jgi:tRNA 2-thiouridine synthesizing protein A
LTVEQATTTATRTIDLRGMKCPAPIVALNNETRDFPAGEQFEAVADDPAFELDVKAWCRRKGHELVRLDVSSRETRATIRRPA